jgi:hypothetical protein
LFASGQLAVTRRARVRRECLNRRDERGRESPTKPGRGLSQQRVRARRDTWLLAVPFGKVVLQRAVVERLGAGALERGHIIRVLHALQEFFVVLDWDDDGDGFAFAHRDFGFDRDQIYKVRTDACTPDFNRPERYPLPTISRMQSDVIAKVVLAAE